MNTLANPIPVFESSINNAVKNAIPVILQQEGMTTDEKTESITRIKRLLIKHNAALVAHYYTSPDLQRLADETGGYVSDSLDMARFGMEHRGKTLVVAGVRFMGETAKILNPEKRVLMPDLQAECSLDIGCPADQFSDFCDAHPDRTVVVYANTSAKVKARADWVVTSGIALKVVQYLANQGKKILWAPDKYLGSYVQKQSGADILLWQGSCIIHEAFKANALREMKVQYPEAAVLVHPESPENIIELADIVGSTTTLIKAVATMPNQTFIVATDNGIFHKMQQVAPEKKLLEAPSSGVGATCISCAHCPWMAMNGLKNLEHALDKEDLVKNTHEIIIDEEIREKAYIPIKRLMDFARAQ